MLCALFDSSYFWFWLHILMLSFYFNVLVASLEIIDILFSISPGNNEEKESRFYVRIIVNYAICTLSDNF